MRWVLSLAAGVALSMSTALPAAAQSTIFNIPTTDTVATGKGYFEFDYMPQTPGPDEGDKFQIFVPRVVFGAANNLEAGANLAVTKIGDESLSYFQPDAKYKFYADDAKGLAAAAGVIWYIPVNHRDFATTWGLVYGNFSKKIKDGPRFTIGPYGVIAGEDDFSGRKGGIIAGYEQPLTPAISFVADWFSGKNFFGYFTPGVSIVLPRNGLLNIGYCIGNDSFKSPSNHNRMVFVYYGVTFP
jgi:hypothetical protein